MILRIRHPEGTERVSVRTAQTLLELRKQLADKFAVAPVTRVQLFTDMSCRDIMDDDDLPLGSDGLELEHGDMLSVKIKPQAAKRPRPPSSEARPKARKASGGEFTREGKTPRDIALAYVTFSSSLSGEGAWSQMAAAARLDAVKAGKAAIESVPTRGKQAKLCARFTGMRKDFEEICPHYDGDELTTIIRELLTRQTTSHRRQASSGLHLLTLEELARRSPPMFWSLFAAKAEGVGLEEKLAEVVRAAQGAADAGADE